jgi:hypothetical protein
LDGRPGIKEILADTPAVIGAVSLKRTGWLPLPADAFQICDEGAYVVRLKPPPGHTGMPNNDSRAKNFSQASGASICSDISKRRRVCMGTACFLSYGMTTSAELLSDLAPFLYGAILGMRGEQRVCGS